MVFCFQGSVEFIESDDFHIEVNITAPSNDDLAKVHYNYTMLDGSVLLQLVSAASWNISFIVHCYKHATLT